jgi:hypothetical protein
MKRFVAAAIFVLGACVTDANAQASRFTGKDLFEYCTSDQTSVAYFSCVLFIRGFLVGVNLTSTGTGRVSVPNSNMFLCLPNGLNAGLAAAAIVNSWRSIQLTKGDVGPLEKAEADVVLPTLLMLAYPCK